MGSQTVKSNKALASLIATLSLIAAAFPPVSLAGAGTSGWLPEIADSATLTGPVIVEGMLEDSRGRPTAGNVMALAWPRQETMATLQPGDAVRTTPVAKETVGRDGAFALRIDPSVPLAELASSDGTINLDLWGETKEGWSQFSFPITVAAQSTTGVDGPEALGLAVVEPEALEVTLQPQEATTQPVPSTSAPAADKACTNVVVANYPSRVAIVGEVYPGPHSTADFQYQQGSSSSVGVAVDLAGGPVTWTTSGTTGVTSTGTIDYPTQAANAKKVFETTIGYQNVHRYIYGSMGCVDQGNQFRPYQWEGGSLSYNAASAPTASYCSAIQAGTTITKTTASAITFNNGIKVSSVIGFDLSSKTGFNTTTKIKHVFSSSGQLCGSNAYWPDAARIVGK